MRTTISEPLRVLLADVTDRHLIVHRTADAQASRVSMLRYSNESGTESRSRVPRSLVGRFRSRLHSGSPKPIQTVYAQKQMHIKSRSDNRAREDPGPCELLRERIGWARRRRQREQC